jgi:hypothetical protein
MKLLITHFSGSATELIISNGLICSLEDGNILFETFYSAQNTIRWTKPRNPEMQNVTDHGKKR